MATDDLWVDVSLLPNFEDLATPENPHQTMPMYTHPVQFCSEVQAAPIRAARTPLASITAACLDTLTFDTLGAQTARHMVSRPDSVSLTLAAKSGLRCLTWL